MTSIRFHAATRHSPRHRQAGAVLFATTVLAAMVAQASAYELLPGGGTATGSGGGAVRAWYEMPTTRYDHGVLGDAVEAGALVAEDAAGKRYEVVLPDAYVFEDVTPRIADLDGDGRNEIITIRTEIRAGAAVAVYAIGDGALVERAATAPIGLAHRWLSIAAIADFTTDGGAEIAVVKTPHIGGKLEILSLRGNDLVRVVGPLSGYSTHFIGSMVTSLAAAKDIDGDGYDELAMPSQNRREVVTLSFVPEVRVVDRADAKGQIDKPITIGK